MYSTEFLSSILALGMSAEYSKVRAAAHNIAYSASKIAPYHHVNFDSMIKSIDHALTENSMEPLSELLNEGVAIETRPHENISLDREVEAMASAERRFGVLAEIYQRHSALKLSVYRTKG